MVSLAAHTRQVILRLLLVAAVAVSHCCLIGHAAWAADAHGGAIAAHLAPGHAVPATWQGVPAAPMVCGGAHGMTAARVAVPAPAPAATPVAAGPVPDPWGSGPERPVHADRARPDPSPPSRAGLQSYLI